MTHQVAKEVIESTVTFTKMENAEAEQQSQASNMSTAPHQTKCEILFLKFAMLLRRT